MHQNKKGQKKFAEELDFLPQSAKLVVDGGCGRGEFLAFISDRVDFAIGLDISLKQLQFARNRPEVKAKNNVCLVVGDLENIPIRSHVFDYFVSRFALHHTELEKSLPEVKRTVSRQGRMINRDLVSRFYRFHRNRIWQIAWGLFISLKKSRQKGFGSFFRILASELSSYKVRHRMEENNILSPKKFVVAHQRWLPGAVRHGKRPNIIFWNAPGG